MTMIDNRDLSTTWIHTKAEVDPWDLVVNAIENAPIEPEGQDKLIKELNALRTKANELAEG